MSRTPGLSRTKIGVAALALVAMFATSTAAVGIDNSNTLIRNVALKNGQAKNVILLIGDGMGDSEITIARNYAYGAAGKMALDELPMTGAMTTFSVLESNPSAPDYTPESASTATAWSTGTKTADGRISTAPGTDADLTNIVDLVEKSGRLTGIVTTSELSDATPAAPMAHVTARACQGPLDLNTCPTDSKASGGPGSIVEQSVDHKVDVLLGGGAARYNQTFPAGHPQAGSSTKAQAASKGYNVVESRDAFQAVNSTPVLGLFASGNLPTRWEGPTATRPVNPTAVRCNENNSLATANPTLGEMTTKAIKLLDKRPRPSQIEGRYEPGFFLQVESASIDKQDHVSEPCEQIGETVDFDAAVRAALDFAKRDRNTLVIVTADHAHTSQIVEVNSTNAGFSSILTTDEGRPMQVTYGTGNTATSQGHTGSQVRVAALGPQGANVVGVIDQTDIFQIMERALRLKG